MVPTGRGNVNAAAVTAAVSLSVLLGLPSRASAIQAFQESAGQVVIEAEHYDGDIPRNGQDWVLRTSLAGFSGSGYLTALPNSGVTKDTGYVSTSPEIVYNVQFTATGTYYVWVRGAGPTGNDDSIHAGIDGTGPSSADRLSYFSKSLSWSRKTTDSGTSATLLVSSPGLHTIHVWMREDGVGVDKILLRMSNSSTAPSGTGPAESSRVTIGPPPDTTPPAITITSPLDGAIITAP